MIFFQWLNFPFAVFSVIVSYIALTVPFFLFIVLFVCLIEGGFAPVLSGLPAGVPPGHPASGAVGAVPPTSVAGGVASVNTAIQKIAQRYCGDCKVGIGANTVKLLFNEFQKKKRIF